MIHSMENRMPEFDRWSMWDQSYVAAENAQARSSQSQRTDIVLYTQEGDKVTLSSSAQYQTKYATYEGLAGVGSMMAWEKDGSFEMNSETQFLLTIEGNLNDKEKTEIQKALKAIDKIMKDLLSGDMDKAVQHSMKLGQFDTLKSLSADLQIEKEIYYERNETTLIAGNRISKPPADRLASATQPSEPEAAAVNDITGILESSGAVRKKLVSILDQYFSELEKNLSDGNSRGRGKMDVADRVKSGLQDHIQAL